MIPLTNNTIDSKLMALEHLNLSDIKGTIFISQKPHLYGNDCPRTAENQL